MQPLNAANAAPAAEKTPPRTSNKLPRFPSHTPSTARRPPWTHVLWVGLTLLALIALWRPTSFGHRRPCPHKGPSPATGHEEVQGERDTVPLEIHVMSKCPDARDCLRKLIVPTMVQVSDKVNFTMSFIGSIDEQSDAVSCKHGPSECLGNIILLCAAHVYPDVKLSLGFANCLISDYPHIPNRDLVEGCAMEHGLDFQKLNSCISDDGAGIRLLRDSIQRSQENNVTKSCTVRLAGKVRCIRDGGEWYDCPGGSAVHDLVKDIDAQYDGKGRDALHLA